MSKITCFNNTKLEDVFNSNKVTEQFEENAAVNTIKAEYEAVLAELNTIKEELGIPTDESKIITSEIKFQKEESKIMFQIVGEKAAQNLDQADEVTTRIDNLQIAKEMEKSNKSPQEIRLATGWERGGETFDVFAKTDEEILNVLKNNNVITKIDC